MRALYNAPESDQLRQQFRDAAVQTDLPTSSQAGSSAACPEKETTEEKEENNKKKKKKKQKEIGCLKRPAAQVQDAPAKKSAVTCPKQPDPDAPDSDSDGSLMLELFGSSSESD